MKKLLLTTIASMVVLSGFSAITPAAQSAYQPTLGYIEEVTPGYVKGWVYNNDQPLTILLAFQSVNNPGETRYYSITNQQVSNKIAYFSQRADVQDYLHSKYGAISFRYPQGFLLTGQYLPGGQWQLKSATVQSILGESVPIISKNKILTIESSQLYLEGYVDLTSGPIKGWAYSNNNARPEIKVTLSRSGGADQRAFILPQNVDQQDQMLRTRRDDVESFLVNQRGQSNRYDADWNLGFTFNYRYEGLLPSGMWHIDSIQADGVDIPYGNTNPSEDIYVP